MPYERSELAARRSRRTTRRRLFAGARTENMARNLRCKAGEIDLLCLETAILVVVEVRQRRQVKFGGALGSVTCAKKRRIIRAAQFFLQKTAQWRRFAVRFDVIAVEGLPDGAHRIDWVKDAFRA